METKQLIANRFQISDLKKDLLGRGGMGDVYRSTDTQTGQTVAIKVLKPDLVADNPDIVARFVREGEALRQLNHPNIVKLLDAIEEAGQHYLVMEYVQGGSLQDVLDAEGRLSISRAVEICLDLADALTRAHRLNIIHRDLKPANVLLAEDGTPRLTDFGIARVEDDRGVTKTGVVIGTPHYLSPEACNGEPLDSRTDIWAFGVLLYELLTGERPFSGATIPATLMAIMTQPVPDLSQLRPDISDPLADLIYRMLEKEAEQRIPSVRLVGAELEAILENRPVSPITPSPIPGDAPKHNLPLQTTSFVGREKELEEIGRLLSDEPNCRLLTLIGPGGMGKTRLSIQAAQAVIEDFAQGACFVPLAPISSDAFLPSVIAEALDLKFYGSRPPREQLLDHLQGQHLLLVLDNFEHLLASPTIPPLEGDRGGAPSGEDIGGIDLLADILQAAPQVKLLVSSRERLNLQQEWPFELQGLTFPQTSEIFAKRASEVSTTYSSLALFVERAKQAQATFNPTAEDLPHIINICRLVGGMPLGLELAAAWMPMMSCEEIADEIARSLDFLSTTLRNVPERHRSLRAVFRYSWRVLTAEEQAVYRELSVFRGGFTREAVAQVTSASLRQLASLVGKSLLRRRNDGRYEIHELLRQYAAEKLAESPAEQEATHAAHAAYFATFLEQRQADLRGSRQLEAVTEIAADFENVRQCWQWLVDHRDADKLYQTIWPLFDFCQLRGQHREGEQVFRLAVEALPAWSEETATKTQRMAMGKLLSGYGWLATRVGSIAFGPDLFRQSVALLRPLQPAAMRELAMTLIHLGFFQHVTGDASAWQSMEESLALARAAGDNFLIGFALINMGQTAEYQGEYRRAETYFQESAKILGAIGEKHYRSYTLNNWGRAAYGMGHYAQAEQLIREALPIRRQFDDQISISWSLLDLGKLAFMRGAYIEAERQIYASLEIAERIRARSNAAQCYNALGWVARVRGDLAQAEEYHQQSLTIHRESGGRIFLLLPLNSLAQIAIERQEYEQARQYLEESLTLGQELANVGAQAVALALLGHIAVAEGALADCARFYRQALEIVTRTGAAPVALDVCVGVAQLYLDSPQSQRDAAATLLALARDNPATIQETRDKAKAILKTLPTEIVPPPSQDIDLWTTAQELVAELSESGGGESVP